MTNDRREEPLLGARFRVEIDGLDGTGVTEVLLPEGRIAPGRGKTRAVHYGPLTLKRAMTASRDWYRWWDDARGSAKAARRVAVVLLDASRRDVQRWTFTGTVPVAYSVSTLDAGRGAVLVETLELSVRGFTLAPGD